MTTVAQLFRSAGLDVAELVAWGEPLACADPGVYVVATTSDPEATDGLSEAPISTERVVELLSARPELTLDGRRPSHAELAGRLASMWVPGEHAVYIGLAGTSLRKRVNQYYRTPLGARAPHAGGWPLKTLAGLDRLTVFASPCDAPAEAEANMLGAFRSGLDDAVHGALLDPDRVMPFANLEYPKGNSKAHGIKGARQPKAGSKAPGSSTTPSVSRPVTSRRPPVGGRTTQRVTEADIRGGRIRVPSRSKDAFPAEWAHIDIDLRGESLNVRWDPKFGPDKERSGVVSIPKRLLAELVKPNEVLSIERLGDGVRIR